MLCIVFSPLNNRTGTCFHNLLNQLPTDEATVWNYCQLFTTTNNAALSTIIGSKSRNTSNLEILPIALKKEKLFSLQVHGSVCFPTTQLKLAHLLLWNVPWLACLFSGRPLLGPLSIFTEFSALCYFLSTRSPSGQISHNIIWGQRVNCMKAFFDENW